MDLVITIDTSVAHLAGVLGREVWVLLPHAADWRWLLDRADSPWYPTARLFRQSAPGNRAWVVARVRAELDGWGRVIVYRQGGCATKIAERDVRGGRREALVFPCCVIVAALWWIVLMRGSKEVF